MKTVTDFSAIRNVSISHVIRWQTRTNSTACSATVRCTRWETAAAGISNMSELMERSKTAAAV